MSYCMLGSLVTMQIVTAIITLWLTAASGDNLDITCHHILPPEETTLQNKALNITLVHGVAETFHHDYYIYAVNRKCEFLFLWVVGNYTVWPDRYHGKKSLKYQQLNCSQTNPNSGAIIGENPHFWSPRLHPDPWSSTAPQDRITSQNYSEGYLLIDITNISAAFTSTLSCYVFNEYIPVQLQFITFNMALKGCPVGWYGQLCDQPCNCTNGGECHTFIGQCICQPGYTGDLCQTVASEVQIVKSSGSANISFVCYLVSTLPLNITQQWLFNGQRILPQNSYLFRNTSTAGHAYTTLVLDPIKEEQEGDITCIIFLENGDHYQTTTNFTLAAYIGMGRENLSLGENAALGIFVMIFCVAVILMGIWCIQRRYGCTKCYWNTGTIFQPDVDMEYQEAKSAHNNNGMENDCNGLEDGIINEWWIDRHQVKKGRKLGEGAFCQVFQGKLRRPSTIDIALKVIKDSKNQFARRDLTSEFRTLVDLCPHPNIVKLYGITSFTHEKMSGLTLVLEYMHRGSLLGLLRETSVAMEAGNEGKATPGSTFLKLVTDITSGMSHMASLRIIHRDLAARNVLVSEDLVAKIGDFGLSRDCYLQDFYRMQPHSEKKLPVYWMSPESIMNYEYTTKSDVWSFGILLWEICSIGKSPYAGINGYKLLAYLQQGLRLLIPSSCPQEWVSVMKTCWSWHPHKRPNFPELDKYFKSLLEKNQAFPRFTTGLGTKSLDN